MANSNLKNKYLYEFQIGPRKFFRHNIDDVMARKLLARYLKILYALKLSKPEFIQKYGEYPYTVVLQKIQIRNGILQVGPVFNLENFIADKVSIEEFYRVYKGKLFNLL